MQKLVKVKSISFTFELDRDSCKLVFTFILNAKARRFMTFSFRLCFCIDPLIFP
jgi:hypothetical protein